ncbi:MAG: glycosyl transferase family 39, partial [Variovorax sp.]|nr:glycosyl transferase family 39 [Variovorax sp.]
GALAAVERSRRSLRALRWTMAGGAALCLITVGALGQFAPSPMAGLDTPALREGAADEPVLMLDVYVYELPMAWRLVEPVKVWADWTPGRVVLRDNWRKELFDAGEFDTAARDRLLVGLDGLASVLCAPHPTRVVSTPAAPVVFPWLARAEMLAANPEIAVWRFPGSASGDPACLRDAVAAVPTEEAPVP